LAIWFGVSVVTVIYTFANVAYFTLLTPKEMVASSAVAAVSKANIYGLFLCD
jgi:hypothetical protein